MSELDRLGHNELNGWSPNSKIDFAKILRKSPKSIVVARENNKIIGYASSRADKESKWLWLEDVYVLKNKRKKGVARKLLNKIVEYKKKVMPSRKLVLLTADINLKVFQKIRFKKTMNFMEYQK